MKKILIIISSIFICYLAFNFFTRNVEKSIEINAPLSKVWPQVKNFKNWKYWSPWAEEDPTIINTYSNIDGAVGTKVSWVGEKAGSGSMTITEISENKKMKYHLEFYEPWQSESDGFVSVQEKEGKTIVTWGMINKPGFMVALINMDMMVGGMFERGLTLLNEHVLNLNAAKVEEQPLKVEKGIFKSIKYLSIRHNDFPIKSLTGNFFGENFGNLLKSKFDFIEKGYATALYYSFDEEKGIADVAIALPISSEINTSNDGFEIVDIIDTESVFVDYYGNYKDLGKAHKAIHAFLIKENQEDYIAIEEYITDPSTSSNPMDWHTRVSYIILK